MVFTTLAHLMDEDFLTEAFYQLRKDAAAGIDEMTVTEYEVNLKGRITNLHQRLVNRQYRAQPARRVWIPKGDGGQRPLAILVLEDKIVQRAVAKILEAIYEPYFHEFSYGFRPGRSAHQALTYLRQQCLKQGINWIIDADISKFFDTISWEQLRTILQKRMNDGALLRLIGMWLHVGVMEDDRVVNQELGTPQGAPISPILANIFLHIVLDEWFQNDVRKRMKGSCFLARFADDFVMGFNLKSDAERGLRGVAQALRTVWTEHPPGEKPDGAIQPAVLEAGQGTWKLCVSGVHALLGQDAQRWVDHQAEDPRKAAEPFSERDRRLVQRKPACRHSQAIRHIEREAPWALSILRGERQLQDAGSGL